MAQGRRGKSGLKRLIVTGDDFGASTLVNEAIEQAHRGGILNTACLMVAGAAAGDAVQRARRMPSLRVGLHLVLVDGRPLLQPAQIPALVDSRGELTKHLVGAGFNFFFNPAARRQLRDEIRAQFEAYRATGLPLDHVNGHNHMQLHPTILSTIIEIGRDYGMKAMRVPYEPFGPSWRAMHNNFPGRLGNSVLLAPMLEYVRARLRAAGVSFNDYVFGLNDTGHMTRERVLAFLGQLEDGVTEMYFHPATLRWPGMAAGAQGEEELAALTEPGIASYVRESDIELTTFSEIAARAA